MKYIKLIILASFLSTIFTGCSYVSDYAEGLITKRASFSVDAVYDGSEVDLSWSKTDSDDSFAGIEIYRTSQPNDEYARYELVASRYDTSEITSGTALTSGSTESCSVNPPVTPGVYFYRVAFIHIETDEDDNLYDPTISSEYYDYTFIDAVSGYSKIIIP